MTWHVGVDSGGTFTDLVALDSGSGAIVTAKVPSSPAAPHRAVISALEEGPAWPQIDRVVHGTTVATNALVERRGARVCFVTTRGFEDVPHIQRINRPRSYDLQWRKPTALVARRDTVGVSERIGPSGDIIEHLADVEIDRVVDEVYALVEARAVGAVAICLLHSFTDDRHEQALAAALSERLPGVPCSVSSVVSPVWREYERASTTICDAFLRPTVERYLGELWSVLERVEQLPPVLILKSNGGTATPDTITPSPVSIALSGLAGGAVGGSYFAARVGAAACVTLDIGGTSTDVGFVSESGVRERPEYELEWGLPIVSPVVDVRPQGAGGGSIAAVDSGGLLTVGPASAGADPGPAAYGLGGTDATVSDANIVLGRINPAYFLGGKMSIDVDAAHTAVRRIGDRIGLSPVDAARAIVAIANENIANGVRLMTIERGIDPGRLTLIAFGGAGPLQACEIAESVGMQRVVIPPNPGLTSAFGAAIAQLRVSRRWTVGRRSNAVAEETLRDRFETAADSAVAELQRDGLAREPLIERSLACRYKLQNYEHEIAIHSLDDGFLAAAVVRFHELHELLYGYSSPHEDVEIVHCSLTGREAAIEMIEPAWFAVPAVTLGTRRVIQPDGDEVATPVVRRGTLGETLTGPVVLEEPDSTVFVPTGWRVSTGPSETLLIDREGDQ